MIQQATFEISIRGKGGMGASNMFGQNGWKYVCNHSTITTLNYYSVYELINFIMN